MSSAICFNLDQSKVLSSGNRLCRYSYPFPEQALVFTSLEIKSFENSPGKGEIVRNERFLLFYNVFFTFGEFRTIFVKITIFVYKFFQFIIQ